MIGRRGLVCAAVLAIAATVVAQQAPSRDQALPMPTAGTASLTGTVVNDATGRPVRHATVNLFSVDNGLRLVASTGDDGTFGFSDLPAARYSVAATKVGYVAVNFGARKSGRPGVPISIAEGEKRTGVTLRLPPGGVVTGAVRTPTGEPMPGARVMLLKRSVRFDTGEPTLARAPGGAAGIGLGDLTDDRGRYRWYGLPADDYYVVALPNGPLMRDLSEMHEITAAEVDWAARALHTPTGTPLSTPPPAPGPAVDYAPVFYPGVATLARASMVSVRAGEERDGIDVVIEMVPAARITGTVSMPGGGTLPPIAVNILGHDTIPGIPFSGFGNARVDREGHFSSGGLVPGDYTVMVRPVQAPGGAGAPPALFGVTTVTVNGADVEASVVLESGVTVSGHVAFEGTAPKVAGIRVMLVVKRTSQPAFGVPNAVTDATGAFTFAGVAPGSYHLAAITPAGWQLQTATGGGQDALDGYLEVGRNDITDAKVTLTDRLTEVRGSLVDAQGKPAPEYTIIIFPADKALWSAFSRRILSTKPATDGRFVVPNLPPGDYRIAAVTDVEDGEWFDPAFLTEIASASRPFTLADGEKKVEDFRLAGGS